MSTSNTRLFTITGRVLPKSRGEQQPLLSSAAERLAQSIRAHAQEKLWQAAFSPRERAAIRARGPRVEGFDPGTIEAFEQVGL